MKKLYAPWRSSYTASADRTKNEEAREHECVFCTQLKENNDEKYLILKRFSYSFVLLNSYPYNAGHLLILPLTHQADLYDLSSPARAEIMEVASASVAILKDMLKPHGFNLGVNLGKAAGASIPSHLHMHLLPRWNSDTNFLPTLGDTKVVSFDLLKIYEQLKPAFDTITL